MEQETGLEPDSTSALTSVQSNGYVVSSKAFAAHMSAPRTGSTSDMLSIPPDLQIVTEAWADLPGAVRAGIVAMVRAVNPALK
jgi:hypothetical protein